MKPNQAPPRQSETTAMLALTLLPYDSYNAILPQIKERLAKVDKNYLRVLTFEKVLEEELPLTTARRAYSTAIRVAMGETNVSREYVAPRPRLKKETKIIS